MDGRPGWLATALNLHRNDLPLWNLLKNDGRLLLTGRGAKAQTEQDDRAGRDGELPGYFPTDIGGLSAVLHVTSGSHCYVH